MNFAKPNYQIPYRRLVPYIPPGEVDMGVIIPLPPKRHCTICSTALAESNHGPLCFRHSQLEITREIERDAISERGDRRCSYGDCGLYTSGAHVKYCYVHAKPQLPEPEPEPEPVRRRRKLPPPRFLPMSQRSEEMRGVA